MRHLPAIIILCNHFFYSKYGLIPMENETSPSYNHTFLDIFSIVSTVLSPWKMRHLLAIIILFRHFSIVITVLFPWEMRHLPAIITLFRHFFL